MGVVGFGESGWVRIGREAHPPRSSGAMSDVASKASSQKAALSNEPENAAKVPRSTKRTDLRDVPDDSHLRYSPNPFALAGVSAKDATLADAARALDIAPGALFSRLARPTAPALTDRRAPWDPPVLGGRTIYTIERAAWEYAGPMFSGTPHFRDVGQGAVPNCNLLASLASLACVWPDILTRRATVVVDASGARLRAVLLYDGTLNRSVTVSERVPRYHVLERDGRRYTLLPCAQNAWSSAGESFATWPAIYEKAFAAIGLNVEHDQPQLMVPSYWVPSAFDADGLPTSTVPPLTAMTGLPTERVDVLSLNTNALWAYFLEHVDANGHPRVPMIIGSMPASEMPQSSWDRLQLVPGHGYSVLGILTRGSRRFVVLRNPWGRYQPGGEGTLSGQWLGEPLGERGLFAYEIERVKEFFGSHDLCRIYATSR